MPKYSIIGNPCLCGEHMETWIPHQKAKSVIRILVVDDSRPVRVAVQASLEFLGIDVDCAENGQVCVEKVKSSTYDAILLDWNMPVMNGLDCLKHLRTDSANEELRILMITANSDLDKISKALEAGDDE